MDWTRPLRLSLRITRRHLSSSLAIVVSLALSIGAATTVFTWRDNLVRRPFPAIPDGGRLVSLGPAGADGSVRGMPPVSYPTLEEWRRRTSAFHDITAHAIVRAGLSIDTAQPGDPAWVQIVSPNFFPLLNVSPQAGRLFGSDDEPRHDAVAVISDALWRRRFGGAREVIGRTLRLNGMPVTVIGVAPPRFGGVVAGLAFDVWIPVWLQPRVLPGADWRTSRGVERMQAVGRLKPGGTLDAANQELARVARTISEEWGEAPPRSARARWVSDTQLGSLMGPLTTAMLMIAALLIGAACANVAGLLLAQHAARERQFATALALGATRWHIARELLMSSALLAALGGAAGLTVAWWMKNALRAFVPPVPLPVHLDLELRWTTVLFAALVTGGSVIAFGLIPALRASHTNPIAAIRAGASTRAGRSRARQALVIVQMAISVVALAIAGLFLQSVRAAAGAPLGFGPPDKVLLAGIDFSLTEPDDARRIAIASQVLERARALPGAQGAAWSTMVPLGFGGHRVATTRIDGYVPARDEPMAIEGVVVSDGYFALMRIPIVRGRAIANGDRRGTLAVAVVNEAFAARYFRDLDPLGRRLDHGDGWSTIVGVAGNSIVSDFAEAAYPIVYRPFAQVAPTSATLHVRSGPDPKTLVEPLRRELAGVRRDLALLDPRTLAEHIAAGSFVQSLGSSFLAGLGTVALLLSATGISGVLSQFVVQHRRETAVRVALGAPPRAIAGAVVALAARVTGVGALAGTGAALLVARLARSQLIGVSPADPATFAGAAGVLALVALAAALGPAWRAVRSDPLIALRSE